MIADYTCEQCFKHYDSEDDFVRCNGDACNEMVCKECAKPCKNPKCKHQVCERCRTTHSIVKYIGDYCIDCAMWREDKDGEVRNFDFVAKKMSHKAGLNYIKKHPVIREKETP